MRDYGPQIWTVIYTDLWNKTEILGPNIWICKQVFLFSECLKPSDNANVRFSIFRN